MPAKERARAPTGRTPERSPSGHAARAHGRRRVRRMLVDPPGRVADLNRGRRSRCSAIAAARRAAAGRPPNCCARSSPATIRCAKASRRAPASSAKPSAGRRSAARSRCCCGLPLGGRPLGRAHAARPHAAPAPAAGAAPPRAARDPRRSCRPASRTRSAIRSPASAPAPRCCSALRAARRARPFRPGDPRRGGPSRPHRHQPAPVRATATPELQAGELAPCVERVIELVADRIAERRLGSRWMRRRGSLPVFMDADLVTQVLLNVTLNAIQAMPQGGTLRYEMRTVRRAAPARGTGRRAADASGRGVRNGAARERRGGSRSSRSASSTPAPAFRVTCCPSCSIRSSRPSRAAPGSGFRSRSRSCRSTAAPSTVASREGRGTTSCSTSRWRNDMGRGDARRRRRPSNAAGRRRREGLRFGSASGRRDAGYLPLEAAGGREALERMRDRDVTRCCSTSSSATRTGCDAARAAAGGKIRRCRSSCSPPTAPSSTRSQATRLGAFDFLLSRPISSSSARCSNARSSTRASRARSSTAAARRRRAASARAPDSGARMQQLDKVAQERDADRC